jgi:hypothetical protein
MFGRHPAEASVEMQEPLWVGSGRFNQAVTTFTHVPGVPPAMHTNNDAAESI